MRPGISCNIAQMGDRWDRCWRAAGDPPRSPTQAGPVGCRTKQRPSERCSCASLSEDEWRWQPLRGGDSWGGARGCMTVQASRRLEGHGFRALLCSAPDDFVPYLYAVVPTCCLLPSVWSDPSNHFLAQTTVGVVDCSSSRGQGWYDG